MANPEDVSNSWQIKDADSTYLISQWGEGYFNINTQGMLCVRPKKEHSNCIQLQDIVDELNCAGVSLPVVIRFHDILRSKVQELHQAFYNSIEEFNYKGNYLGVYPIKVNQMREVVEEVMDAGKDFDYGLEAGSKTELLAILSMPTSERSLNIINGHKDQESIRLALLGQKMGKNMITVIEKPAELKMAIEISKAMGIKPKLGMRAKLSVNGSGKWAKSSGHHSKFGLTIPEITQAIELLKSEDYLDCLELFHFHIGSQVSDIQCIKDSLTEASRIYCQLIKLGAPIQYFDVGGGLGVNYEGDSQHSKLSINYNIKEYVSDVVYIIKQICDLEQVNHPNIVSESGRAITAHHSCIVTNVFDRINHHQKKPTILVSESDHILVKNMQDVFNYLKTENMRESYYDALNFYQDAITAFKLGVLSLQERAKVETLFNQILLKINHLPDYSTEFQTEKEAIQGHLSEQYLCNFSVFQSIPDAWGIEQVLPIAPLSHLHIEPTQQCYLGDITCDSDGKVDQFPGDDGQKQTIPLHDLTQIQKNGEQYHIGIFLTGAYQDIMGDMHNLFGRLNEVHVFLDPEDPKGYYIEEFVSGNSSSQVLSTLQYSPALMAQNIKSQIDAQVKACKIRPREGVELVDFYESCLSSYTYLKNH